MRDLTEGSLSGHLVAMAIPMFIGMAVQTLYLMIDLYFVSGLGSDAVAAVALAGNVMFMTLALTQVINTSTAALIARAVGEKNHDRANVLFNQALNMAGILMIAALVLGYGLGPVYVKGLAADAEIHRLGLTYLWAFLPSLALQFPMTALGAGLRGTGIVKPGMVVQLVTVLMNIVLAPILIKGWGTGVALGVFGAGLASTLSVLVGLLMVGFYFLKLETYIKIDASALKTNGAVWGDLLKIGLPSGGEYFLMFIFSSFLYGTIAMFGAKDQAGYALAMRTFQMMFMPTLAISFAIPAVAGQNFGAKRLDRVRGAFWAGLKLEVALMLILAALCNLDMTGFLSLFTKDPEVMASAQLCLKITSWNFVASGVIFACSGLFQAMGNTVPSVLGSASRLLSFVLPVYFLSHQSGFSLELLWKISVATVFLQAVINVLFLSREFKMKLGTSAAA